MAEQLTIFVENKPGKLDHITRVLAEHEINIKYISVASLGEYGVIKLLVDKTDEAHAAIKESGYTANQKEVVIAVIDDSPGTLHALLSHFSDKDINIDDCYGFPVRQAQKVAIVLEAQNIEDIKATLNDLNISMINEVES